MTLFLLTLAVFLVIVVAMAVGVIFRRPCLRGSCGGPEVLDAGGESLSCATCPNRKKARRKMASGERSEPTDAEARGLPVVG